MAKALLLARRFLDAGMADKAETHCRTALKEEPRDVDALKFLARTLGSQGRNREAMAALKQASLVSRANARNELGRLSQSLGDYALALECFRRAVALDPDAAAFHYNLATELLRVKQADAAEGYFRKATTLEPELAAAHLNLGTALLNTGRAEEALACFERTIDLDPDLPLAWYNLLQAANYCQDVTPRGLLQMACRFGAASKRDNEPLGREADPGQRLRLGFLSGDFHRHPIGYFIAPVLAELDARAFEVFCYDNRGMDDALTLQLKENVPCWRLVKGLDDASAAALIREDGIDILIDLSGFTARGRMGVLAYRAAPLQVAWIGTVATTGMKDVDAFIGDSTGVPEGEEGYFTEHVVRLPDGWLCYAPPADTPEVTPLPALKRGYITFGCFNNMVKINSKTLALWAEILKALPDSRLILRNAALGEETVRDRVRHTFADLGVIETRIDLEPALPHSELLREYAGIDIALDPMPYSGGLTTCEALWMGVPTITLPGATFASRHTASHLTNVGLTDWIVKNAQAYVAKSLEAAKDLQGLAELRQGLRIRTAASPLLDAKAFTRHLETALRELWQKKVRQAL